MDNPCFSSDLSYLIRLCNFAKDRHEYHLLVTFAAFHNKPGALQRHPHIMSNLRDFERITKVAEEMLMAAIDSCATRTLRA